VLVPRASQLDQRAGVGARLDAQTLGLILDAQRLELDEDRRGGEELGGGDALSVLDPPGVRGEAERDLGHRLDAALRLGIERAQ